MHQVNQTTFIGDYDDATDTSLLRNNDIDVVISLCSASPAKRELMDTIQYVQLPLLDGKNLDEAIDRALFIIAKELMSEQRVLVHCGAGMHRSPTIVAAALSLVNDSPYESVAEQLAGEYPAFTRDSLFEQQVKEMLK